MTARPEDVATHALQTYLQNALQVWLAMHPGIYDAPMQQTGVLFFAASVLEDLHGDLSRTVQAWERCEAALMQECIKALRTARQDAERRRTSETSEG